MNATHILTLLGVSTAEVLSFNVNGLGNGTAETVINLGNGGKLTYTSPVNPPPVQPTEMHDVAYFTYPSSDGGMRLHRRVIVHDGGSERTGYLRGYETSNGADYQFKTFQTRKMLGLRIVPEPITDKDRDNLTHL